MDHTLKTIIKSILDKYYYLKIQKEIDNSNHISKDFEYSKFKRNILRYLSNQKQNGSDLFVFSNNKDQTNIYSNTYALMTYGLLGAIDSLNVDQIFDYIYNHQSEDGLFREKTSV